MNSIISPPKMAAARTAQHLVATAGGGFDIDVLHAIELRDEALIADEIMHGSMTGKFVYDFEIAGTNVSGVSVIGARHLMYHYGSLKHRLVASTMKRGAQFVFTTYPSDYGARMSVAVENIEAMGEDPDFYQVLCELHDTKKNNSLQRERIEMRYERRRDGSYFERPNFQVIAQSKAYRNAVLDLLPQDVVLSFKAEARKLGKSENITENVLDVKRRTVIQFAASKGIALDRAAVGQLGWTEIAGLSDAARSGGQEAFVRSAAGIGIMSSRGIDPEEGQQEPPKFVTGKDAAKPAGEGRAPRQTTKALPAETKPKPAASDGPPDDGAPPNDGGGQTATQTASQTASQTGDMAKREPDPVREDKPAVTTTVDRKDLF